MRNGGHCLWFPRNLIFLIHNETKFRRKLANFCRKFVSLKLCSISFRRFREKIWGNEPKRSKCKSVHVCVQKRVHACTCLCTCTCTCQYMFMGRKCIHIHTHTHVCLPKVTIRNLSPYLGNSAILRTTKLIADLQTKKSCGTAIADLQNFTSAIPQLSAVSCQFRCFLVPFPQLRMV